MRNSSICPTCGERWVLAYCGDHAAPRRQRQAFMYTPSPRLADETTRGMVYRTLLANLSLSPAHRDALRQRGLPDAEIMRRQYRTLPLAGRSSLARRLIDLYGAAACAGVPGFSQASRDGRSWWSVAGAPGLLVPVRNLHSWIVACKIRIDEPGDGPKYTTISSVRYGGPGPGAPCHIPLWDGPPSETIRLTEGELKADVATLLSGVLTVSVPGVAMWQKALPALEVLHPRRVLLAFDADWRSNPHVAQALGQAAYVLGHTGYVVEIEDWNPALGKGIDDLLVAGHVPTLASIALAFNALVRGHARTWTGQLPTVAAEEVPAWR